MGLSKEQVEEHIANTKRRFKSERELKQHGYEFAKLCYQVKKYEDAMRYLKEYITLNNGDYRAHKWMGRLYMATDDHTRAILHYKMSLKLKRDQRDVIISVAELYCKMSNPPVEEVKESLAQVNHMNQSHPAVLALSEKIQSLEGTLSSTVVENLISKQLVLCSSDVNLHIRLVNLYTSTGDLQKAFDYCYQISQKGLFVRNLIWQQCALSVAERFYEGLGCGDTERRLESLISVLEGISVNFVLQISISSLSLCAALLLKYDKVLFVAQQTLRSFSTPNLTVYHIALRDLCGNFYYLISQYLYLHGCVLERATNFQLGQVCLVASLRVSPPDKDSLWLQGLSSRHIVEKCHIAACTRLSTVGRHLMVVVALKGVDYLVNLSKYIALQEKNINLSVIKALFTANPNISGVSVYLGTKLISFSLQESFLVLDDILPDSSCIKLPTEENLLQCDEVFVATSGKDLRQLVWIALTYKAVDLKPDFDKWLSMIFKGLQLDSPDLTRCNSDMLCRCDLEAFLVLLTEEIQGQLVSHCFSEVDADADSTTTLSAALATCLPCSLSVKQGKVDFWDTVHQHLGSKFGICEAASMKVSMKEELVNIRGCRPLQLNLNQLTLLARHFKSRAELVTQQGDSDGISYKSTISVLMKWSTHYWNIIFDVLGESRLQSDFSNSLLIEAQMSLANAALFKCDTSKALRLYSQVKTPQAAWNQSQIYLLLAEKEEARTSKSIQMRVSNFTKALDAVTMAISRLCVDDDPVLKERLYKQQDELKQRLKDVNVSPVAYMLQYEESPPKPHHSSTPAKSSTTSFDHQTSGDCFREELHVNEKDKLLLSLNMQLKQLQEEMEEIKSLHSLNVAPVQRENCLSVPSQQTFVSSAIDSDVKLSASVLAPVISGVDTPLLMETDPYIQDNVYAALHDTASSLPSAKGNHSTGQFSKSPRLLPRLSEPAVSVDIIPFNTPPCSSSVVATLTQDFGSLQPLSGSFVFGLPTSVSKPFKFNPSTSLLSAVPFCVGGTSIGAQSFQCTTSTFSVRNPPLVVSTNLGGSASLFNNKRAAQLVNPSPSTGDTQPSGYHNESTVVTSSSVNLTLPLCSVKGLSDATVSLPVNTTKNIFHETFPTLRVSSASIPVTSTIIGPCTTTAAIPWNFPALEKLSPGSENTSDSGRPSLHIGSPFSQTKSLTSFGLFQTSTSQDGFPSRSDLEVSKQPLFGSVLPWLPQSSTPTTQTSPLATTEVTQISPMQTQRQPSHSKSSSLHPTLVSLLSCRSSSSDPPSLPVYNNLVPSLSIGADFVSEVKNKVTDDTSSHDCDSSPHFEPLVSLPLIEELASGEEAEEILFCHHAKLYRFDNNQWKERGVGDMKILKHKVTGKSRLLMRRDQILKLCCNHFIAANMILTEMKGCLQLAWCTNCDFSDGVSKPEKFAIKFKHQETGRIFKQTFEKCALYNSMPDDTFQEFSKPGSAMSDHQTSSSFGEKPILSQKEDFSLDSLSVPSATWSCDICLIQNEATDTHCAACGSTKPLREESPYTPPLGHWTCSSCLVRNKGVDIYCIACMTQKTEARIPISEFQLSGLDPSFSKSTAYSEHRPVIEYDQNSSLEREPDVYFTPVVSLPENVTIKTGEEAEEVVFCGHAKLFRFDDQTTTWKERGVGNIKILRNKADQKSRMLMRRDQVLKVCCNHKITAGMTMTPMPSTNNTWIWYTSCDFADEERNPGKFAIRFKHQDSADKFKETFDKCVIECEDSSADVQKEPSQLARDDKIVETFAGQQSNSELDDIILTKVELPSNDKIKLSRRLMLPDSFFNYENMPSCPGCCGCIDQINGRYSPSQDQRSKVAIDHHSLFKQSVKVPTSLDVFGSALMSDKSVVGFAELAASKPSKSPFALLHHGSPLHTFKGAGEALFSEKHFKGINDPEAEGDVQFKALVSLPEVDVKTGEENEEVLFTHRAKLFRFDANASQWKERGIGDIKLLRSVNTNKTRILMRRDQILKVCCNHFIAADMTLLAHQERSWMWYTLDDFADEVPRPEKFAVKFKTAETAQKFKITFEECVSRCKSDIISPERTVKPLKKVDTTDISLQERFAPKAGSWVCSICSVCNPESVALCLACQTPKFGQNKLLSPLSSPDILKKLHICSPTQVPSDRNSGGFQLPLNITLPTCSIASKSTTTVCLSPRLTSPVMHSLASPMSINEKEEVTFSARGILYLEDLSTKQWGEGNCGNMKIIKNKLSREKRLLMISENQKVAICAHGITSMMHLRPHTEKERAWIWNGFDNSRSTPTKSAVQKYCIQFHSEDDALGFKNSFGTSFLLPSHSRQLTEITSDEVSDESCGENSRDSESGEVENLDEINGSDDDVIFVCEEIADPSLIKKAEELLLPKSFYLYEKKPPCSGCRGCSSDNEVMHTSSDQHVVSKQEEPTAFTKADGVLSSVKGFSSAGMRSFADLTGQEDSISGFSKNLSGFQFDGAGKQLFSLNEEGKEDNPEAEVDIDFQPIISLPETYSVRSWDEDAKILFSHRAKLFRFDGTIKQWKERGVGDMKIVQHHETKKFCLIMRRDQIFKLCCNHYVTEDMEVVQLQTDRSWMWFTPSDFSGDKPQPEQFAIKFKYAEKGLEFKRVFDECVAQQQIPFKQLCPPVTINDIAPSEVFKPDMDSWGCPRCLVKNKDEDYECAACGCKNPGRNGSDSAGTTIKLGSTGGMKVSSPMLMPRRLQDVCLSTSRVLNPSLPPDSMAQAGAYTATTDPSNGVKPPQSPPTPSGFITTLQPLAGEHYKSETDQEESGADQKCNYD